MASFEVVVKPSVEKDLRPLPQQMVARIMERIESLKENPFPRHSLRLAGAVQQYRLRVADYRVIYGVDTEAKQVTIHHVRHRREAYR